MPAGVKPFSEADKRAAVELHKAGVSLKKIREQLNMSERGLRRVLAYARKHPEDPVKPKSKNAGRPTKLSLGTVRKMKRLISNNPSITAKAIKSSLPELAAISVRTIQSWCKDQLKLPCRKMVNKPLLTDRMRNDRLTFARRYAHWGVEQWKKVMFSDESHFQLTFGNQHYRCRRSKESDKFDLKFTRKRVKHAPKLMVWGCFSWKGRGGLEFLRPREMMNGERYRQVLDSKLELFMHAHRTTHFLQDGAPCHKSRLVTQWFAERPHIHLIKWPGNSPDLNPIENVWAWMKQQLREVHPTNLQELQQEITRLWVLKMDDSPYLKKLVESMPNRLQEVIAREGNTTHY
jgi:transposase